MTAVEEEAREAGELRPADIESWRDGVTSVVASNIGADDRVTAFGAE